ncbi:23S rRNA (uracil(1939)-C(5))-methyltransferase RlmD [Staphylococcus massiliensis]|uniref:23S rRNA (uracil(1939)-C(5))-methyltransferase RlmD n=1 Tax=Staphylococcus massiliensis TaxID=555791 RepID=UPI001EDFE736|nr:23S rRNA (uracil(1939)-C(5))-methyltransferase RlmD [Staphylococcus massiliensis]MCG3402658.1 23S rRNA (uracil(1939)-C(5))-methyltransferase RlmD [Staphylococcus massiliensis]
MNEIKKNDVMQGRVVDLTHVGHGVVKVDRYPIFVPHALIDEDIEFKVIKVKKNFAIGKLNEVTTASDNRVTPPCVYYSKCGGCQLQHMNYESQLEMKFNQVYNLFTRKGSFKDLKINQPIGMEHPWHYRNKSQLPVGTDQSGDVKMGFYRQRSHDIIDMDTCLIQHDVQNALMVSIKKWLNELNVSIYNEQLKSGLVRHVIIRASHYKDAQMVIFVTNGKKFKALDTLIKRISTHYPSVKSIIHNINTSHSNVIMGKKSQVMYGDSVIEDDLDNLTFEIGDRSFYQINVTQTEKLYRKAIEYAGLTGNEIVIDAYCGIGTIGLYMAPHANHVYGVEVVESAIEDAKLNRERNGIQNIDFEAGKAEEIIIKWQQEGLKPDVVMVDPPRKGCDQTFINTLLELQPKRIVYISCNPSTQARDAERLSDSYDLQEITPVDMFPHTTHIETVALFERKDA